MQCPRCQAENREGLRFCEDCGTRLAATCPSCGAELTRGKRFCGSCGTSLAGAQSQTRFGSPESYTPKHLAERILTSKAALGVERKQVTVLFADMKGSMELLADRDPEEARKVLDPILEHMMEAVHRYEGTVNQVMGDGIMALFGAPIAHEDHAVRACYAALRMQENVKKHAEEVRRSHAAVVKIRVGLNSGEVVVRAIGSDLHMDYTAVGQTTHLAARMEQIADPGAIAITPDTLALAEGYVEVKSLGPVPVKGLADAVEVYEVTGAGPARTRLQAAARRGLTRFVGRDGEVEQLRRAQQLAGNGHGQVAAIVGEAGVGKSRLVYEFTHSHRLQGWLVLEAASVSYGKATSYLPVIDLLKGYFTIQDRDALREIREKVMGKLLALDEALKPALPALLALLDVPVDDASWQTLDPTERRQRTLDAVRRLLLREAREQPLLLIFEDLHWIDSETQALLDGLVDSSGSARLLLLVNYRPEYQHPWGGKTYYNQLRLDALPAESAGELLDALLGDDPGLAPLKQLLVKRGNPFFMEETIRTLAETKALAGERGRYRLTQPVQAIHVPATVQTMLAARIDRLAPEDKRLLQTASVVGKDVPWALLQTIAELPDEALGAGLDRLQSAEFLYEIGLFPDLEYTFKHALTHEVTYGGLLQERRRELHARVVDAIETLHGDRLGEQIERLAHHAVRGEIWDKAVIYLQQAALKAATRSAHQEAIADCEQALAALKHLPETREMRERAFNIWLEMRPSFVALGQHERIRDVLRAAEALAQTLDDPGRLGRVASMAADYFWNVGEPQRALELGQRALSIARASADLEHKVTTNMRVGRIYTSLGDYPRALCFLTDAVKPLQGKLIGERFGTPSLPAAACRTWMAWCLAERGEFAAAITRSEEAVHIAETFDQAFSRIESNMGMGFAHLQQGILDKATIALHRGLTISETTEISYFVMWIAPLLAHAYTLAGRIAEGIPLFESAIAQATATNTRVHQGLWRGYLGEAYLRAGRWRDALATTEYALARAREQGERSDEGWVLQLLGEVTAHADPPEMEQAEAYYRQALSLAEELGIRPLIAHCHLGLGKLYRRTGKRQEAQEHLATATLMYREMDMTYWLEQAKAEMRELA